MPRDPLLPESSAAIRTHSPDASGGSERKRRRKVLSCYDCRRRKLQCDRIMPACGRCTKAGHAAKCLYLDDSSDTPTRTGDSTSYPNDDLTRPSMEGSYSRPVQAQSSASDMLARLEYQNRRIKQLEAALTQSMQPQPLSAVQQLKTSKLPLTPESVTALEPATATVNATDRETMLLRGRSFKTQFHGITHPGSLISYIPELRSFTKETIERFPALNKMRQDIHALEDRMEKPKRYVGTDADLKAMLPSKVEADQLVQLYLDNYEGIYHIFHLPTFRQEYAEMWINPPDARPQFVTIVALMTAAAQCLANTEPWLYIAGSSSARERAIATISVCEQWLQYQSQKQVTVADFQIRFLLVLAKMLNASKFKRTWTDAGNNLRFFMAAGLHRNPELLRKPTSILDKELRRRLWSAVSEFELQAAFSRGMVSAPWPQQSDSTPPINIHDEDVDQTCDQLPSQRPLNEFTNMSYLLMANETFSLRYSLNTMLNNIRQTISFEDAKRYTDEIETRLQALPQWVGVSSEPPQALLSITLRQYLLVLHDRQFRHATSHSERDFSKMILIDAATKIIDCHKSLLKKGCRALQFLCHDQMRAALSVCHIVAMPDPQADGIISMIVEQSATQVISDCTDLITDKIYRYGCEQRQLWIVLAANGLMKTKKDPSQKVLYMQEAMDKLTRPYYRILACQEDAPSVTSSRTPQDRSELPNGIVEYFPNANHSAPEDFNVLDPPMLDLDDIAAWTFEDWSFNPAEFQQPSDVY